MQEKILTEEDFMSRCLELALKGKGMVAPNPMVGAVIVHNGEIIGEGYHHEYGGPHAEVVAVNSVQDQSLLPKSTMYVNLEPCSHFGKTPPCSFLIVEKEIKHVVVGILDNHSKVAGKGVLHLTNNGVNVKVGVLEKECEKLNKHFHTFHREKRPYYYLKAAITKDGYIAEEDGKSVAISNELVNQKMHQLRSEVQGIVVGWNTFKNDYPKLNTRHIHGKSPKKIVIGGSHQMSEKVIADNPDWQFISVGFNSVQGDNVLHTSAESWYYDLNRWFHSNQIQSVLVEGGASTINHFFDHTFDEYIQITGIELGHNGLKAAQPKNVQLDSFETIDNNLIQYFKHQ